MKVSDEDAVLIDNWLYRRLGIGTFSVKVEGTGEPNPHDLIAFSALYPNPPYHRVWSENDSYDFEELYARIRSFEVSEALITRQREGLYRHRFGQLPLEKLWNTARLLAISQGLPLAVMSIETSSLAQEPVVFLHMSFLAPIDRVVAQFKENLPAVS